MLNHIGRSILGRYWPLAWVELSMTVQPALTAYATKANASPPYLKEKENKKKEKPLRAVSAYAFYVQDKAKDRDKSVKPNMPGLMKQIAAEWKSLSDDAKAPYVHLATESKTKVAEVRAKAKDARQPPSAYNLYCREVAQRLAGRNMSAPDMLRHAAAEWTAMSAEEKAKRKAEAHAAKEAWKQAGPQA